MHESRLPLIIIEVELVSVVGLINMLRSLAKFLPWQQNSEEGYMSIDALKESESPTSESDGVHPALERGKPELRDILADLDRVYEECINDGSDESTANTIAYQ